MKGASRSAVRGEENQRGYATSPYCFILRQSVTVLIFSASAAWRRLPRNRSSARSISGSFLRLKVEAVVGRTMAMSSARVPAAVRGP